MRLTARVTELISGSESRDRQQRIKLKVAEADPMFKTLIVPNRDDLQLDSDVVVLVLRQHEAKALADGFAAYGCPELADQLRPDDPPPWEQEDAETHAAHEAMKEAAQCLVTCHSYIPRGCSEPHRCTLSQAHAGGHRFITHELSAWGQPQPDDTSTTQEFRLGGTA